MFYVASRGHHADIGGIQAGSMPSFSKALEEEGATFMSFKIVENGVFQEDKVKDIEDLKPWLPVRAKKKGKPPSMKGMKGPKTNAEKIEEERQ